MKVSVAVQKERSFGLSVGGVYALLTLWFLWRGRTTAATATGGVAVILIVPALVRPALLCGPSGLWWRFSHLLGWVNTRVLLSALFVAVLTPVGVLMRVGGWDPLRRRQRPEGSGWVAYSTGSATPSITSECT